MPNRAPEAVGEIDDVYTFVGESVEIALAEYFSDPDGGDLAYAAGSSDEGVATVAVSADTVAVIPTEIDEGPLDKSLNVTIPDSVIEEGLSVVIEIDPDSTIDAEILTAPDRGDDR